jgi:hypothetical protein
MIALSRKMLEEPSEIQLLLPWHAAGTLSPRDASRVDEALARDPGLARGYAVIRNEYAETIALNESLGAPSGLAIQKLFAAIDAEPEGRPNATLGLAERISAFFASLGAVLLLLQAGVIGAVLIKNHTATYQLGMNERDLAGAAAAPHALVRFAPDARVADITALLDKYRASIIGSAKGGMFRLQFGDQAMSKQDLASLIKKLSAEKIVNLAVPAP